MKIHIIIALHVSVFDHPQGDLQSLDKITLLLKHSVQLRRCILCGDVAACREMACVLFVVQPAGQTIINSRMYSG